MKGNRGNEHPWEIAENHAWLIQETKTAVLTEGVGVQNCHLTSEDKAEELVEVVQEGAPLGCGERNTPKKQCCQTMQRTYLLTRTSAKEEGGSGRYDACVALSL